MEAIKFPPTVINNHYISKHFILPNTKDDNLEIKCNNRNQVDDKIMWGLGGGFLSLHSSYVC